MNLFKNQSIQTKIILLIVAVSTINALITVFIQFYNQKAAYKKEVKEKLRILSEVIGQSNLATIEFNHKPDAVDYLSSLKADKHIEYATIFLPDSTKLAEYKSVGRQPNDEFNIPLLSDTIIFKDEVLILVKPIVHKGDPIASIRFEYSMEEYRVKQKQYLKLMLLLIGITVLLATILAFVFQRVLTKPLFSLYHIINKISFRKDYSIRANVSSSDEIGKLTDGFNFMIHQIEQQNNELKKAKLDSDSALKAKERFLANMTHELRTPLNSIIGLANLIEDTELNEEQEKYITNLKISSDHLLAIINDLLEFSKLGSGKYQLEKHEFSIRRSVDRIAHSVEFELKNRNLEFESIVDESLPHFVVGDEHRLNQIILNLVGNAIKFTPKGSIKIEIRVLSETDESINVEFSVEDTGIGIVKEKQEIIFESFTQESNDTTRQYGGTGLGLAITKQLVEIQNGKIWVESEKFKGSKFKFIIPYSKKLLKQPEISAEQIKSMKAKKVLVVDDNAMNLLFTKSLLEKNGFVALSSQSGKDAIKKIKKENFDVILMDLHMPEMDGYETCIEIRKLEGQNKHKVPIVALTAAATINEIKKCFDSGMDDYIVKPFKKEELFAKLLSLLRNKPQKTK